MQTPKARNVTLEVPLKASSKTGRQVKMPPGPDSDSVPVKRTPKKVSPRATDRKSPTSPASELTHLQEELKKTKELLNSSESLKKQVQQEAELVKRQLAATSNMLEESQKQLLELSASEDGRILELRKLSHDRDRAWQSELEALQKQHTTDSSALAFANNEISKLRFDLKESLFVIDELKSQLKICNELNGTLGPEDLKPIDVELLKRNDENNGDLEKLKVELNCARSEVERLKVALDSADKRYQEEYIQSTFQIRSAYELFERTKSESSVREAELESKLKNAEEEIKALEAKKSEVKNIEKNQKKEGESELEMELKKLEEDLEILKVCLLDKEMEIQRMADENKILRMEIEKREKESNMANNEAVTSADSEREAELRRLKIQSDQWRKAAELATAMLSSENDDKFSESTAGVASNYHTLGEKLGLPFSEDTEEELAKKKSATVLKKIGVLLKGGQK